MARVKRAIILAAGKSFQLDGVTKILIRHPKDGLTILDHALNSFKQKDITVVVGYRAIQIMQTYPNLNYVYNPEWALTNNAMSLALALTEEPSYVVAGDIFLEPSLIERLDQMEPDIALTSSSEKRGLSAIHCRLNMQGMIEETYQGPVRSAEHPESLGLFKISTPELLRDWKRRCMQHSNLFVNQLIPGPGLIRAIDRLDSEFFFEINTPTDYLELIRRTSHP